MGGTSAHAYGVLWTIFFPKFLCTTVYRAERRFFWIADFSNSCQGMKQLKISIQCHTQMLYLCKNALVLAPFLLNINGQRNCHSACRIFTCQSKAFLNMTLCRCTRWHARNALFETLIVSFKHNMCKHTSFERLQD